MPKAATGTVGWKNGRWHARVTVKDANGKAHRPWVDLERPDIPNTSAGEIEARGLAARQSRVMRQDGTIATFKGKGRVPADNGAYRRRHHLGARRQVVHPDRLRPPPDRKASTCYDYKSRIRTHVVPELGPLMPPLTVPQLRSFFRDMKAKRSASSVRNTANALTAMVDDWIAEGWIPKSENPMRSREVRDVLPTVESPNPEDIVALPLETVRSLLASDKLPEDRRGLYLLAVTSGMRDGELRGILRSRVDFGQRDPQRQRG